MSNVGFYWHVHHDILAEFCWDYEGRKKYIEGNKLAVQRETRLRLFKPVNGKLPDALEEAGSICEEALSKYEEALSKYEEAWKKSEEVWKKSDGSRSKYEEAWKKVEEALSKYEEARSIDVKALNQFKEALIKSEDEIWLLHEKECKNCPWDGYTIFPIQIIGCDS